MSRTDAALFIRLSGGKLRGKTPSALVIFVCNVHELLGLAVTAVAYSIVGCSVKY